MPKRTKPAIGSITWMDLTVKPAVKVRDFFKAVAGWKSVSLDMGGYSDFCMNQPADGKTVAGVCHARGENANLPSQWLIYINVANLKRSLPPADDRAGRLFAPFERWAGARWQSFVIRLRRLPPCLSQQKVDPVG